MLGPFDRWLGFLGIFNMDPQKSAAGVCVMPLSSFAQLTLKMVLPFILVAELLLVMGVHYLLFRSRCLQRCQSKPKTSAPDAVAMEEGEVADGAHRDSRMSRSAARARSIVEAAIKFHPSRYRRAGLSMYLWSYTQLTTVAVSYLRCVDGAPGQRVVYVSPQIDCKSDLYLQYMPVVAFMLLLSVASPFALVYLLYRRRALIMAPDGSPDRVAVVKNLGIVFEYFDKDAYWWNGIVLLRRAVFVAVESALLLEPEIKFAAFAFINLLSLAVHMYKRPFLSDFDDSFESGTLFSLCALSIFLTSFRAPYSEAEEVTLFISVVVPALVAVVCVVIAMRRAKKEAEAKEKNAAGDGDGGAEQSLNAGLSPRSRLKALTEGEEDHSDANDDGDVQTASDDHERAKLLRDRGRADTKKKAARAAKKQKSAAQKAAAQKMTVDVNKAADTKKAADAKLAADAEKALDAKTAADAKKAAVQTICHFHPNFDTLTLGQKFG
jgi:hypothetical protein